jgi:hypothetical protein
MRRLRFAEGEPHLSAVMTAAQEHPTRPASRARVNVRSRWQCVLGALGLFLPVPLFAATGLALPLPPTVERLAAALVPWAEAAALDEPLARGLRGSVVLASGDRLSLPSRARLANESSRPDAPSSGSAPRSRGSGRADTVTNTSADRPAPATADDGVKPRGPARPERGTVDSNEQSKPGFGGQDTDAGGEEPKPVSGGDDPTNEPDPVEDTVDKVAETTHPVVDEVENKTNDVVETVDSGVGGVVDELAPGLGG